MNIAKLNTVSLDDKTFIIKRGTSGGGSTPDTPSGERRYAYITNESFYSNFALSIFLTAFVAAVKYDYGGMAITSPMLMCMTQQAGVAIEPIALAVDLDMVIYGTGSGTLEEGLTQNQELKEAWEALPKLTKEEFYSFE